MVYLVDPKYLLNIDDPERFFFEMGPIRPPSEWGSLLIKVSGNCPWNGCRFCYAYKGTKFEPRSVAEIKKDIEVVKILHDKIKEISWQLGLAGKVNKEILEAIVQANQEFYEGDLGQLRLLNLDQVAGWITFGEENVFLQDANALLMKTSELIEVLGYLKKTFPKLKKITAYARSKTCVHKSPQELEDLSGAGLTHLNVGLESGDDWVLKFMRKGVTSKEHIIGGQKVVESGISLSLYVMPGLGGWLRSKSHIIKTANVLNQINPDFIRIRSLVIQKDSPLFNDKWRWLFGGSFEDRMVDEIQLLVEKLNCHSYLTSDQMSNLLPEVEGQLPDDKEKMLKIISEYKNKSPMAKLWFMLERRLDSYLDVYRVMNHKLYQMIQAAGASIENGSFDAKKKTHKAIRALKEDFV